MALTTEQILDIARKHQSNTSSSALCYEDAVRHWHKDDDAKAQDWALRSLKYSVGIFHPDYKAVKVAVKEGE